MAKLDIAADSDSEGRGFESLRAGHTCGEQIAHRRFSFLIAGRPRLMVLLYCVAVTELSYGHPKAQFEAMEH